MANRACDHRHELVDGVCGVMDAEAMHGVAQAWERILALAVGSDPPAERAEEDRFCGVQGIGG
jgi:hypothetical protein